MLGHRNFKINEFRGAHLGKYIMYTTRVTYICISFSPKFKEFIKAMQKSADTRKEESHVIMSQHRKASNHHANLPLEMYSFTL